jgi:hypothetical protein
MEAIETTTIKQDFQTYRITIYADSDAPNPLEDWSEIGTILSLNRRHINFNPGRIEEAIGHDPDAVPLSYYEHGRCLWCVAGELTPVTNCLWDSVHFAGVWLPDAETLVAAGNSSGRTRRQFMRERARQACDVYTNWCNGEVYGFEIAKIITCPCCGEEKDEPVESCWGFYGLEDCQAEAQAKLGAVRPFRPAQRTMP